MCAARGRLTSLIVLGALALFALPASAAASDFWDEVRQPGLHAYRRSMEEATLALRAHRFRRALEIASEASRELPDLALAYAVVGLARGELGELEAAAMTLQQALAIDESVLDDPAQGTQAATFFARADHPERAAKVLRRLLGRMRDGPRRQVVYGLYGDVLLTMGPEFVLDAIRAYREALRSVAHDPRASLGLALALHRTDVADATEWRELASGVSARGRLDALVASLPVPEWERAARRAIALESIGDRAGARDAWDHAREGPWAAHAEAASRNPPVR